MKKNFKFWLGFPVGIMFLIISYIAVYFIDGEETYLIELEKLVDVEFLSLQFLYIGLIYTLVFKAIYFFDSFFKRYERNVTAKEVLKFACVVILLGIVYIIADVLDMKGVLEGETGIISIGIAYMIIIGYFICYVIYKSIEECKINKALKERRENKK